MSKTMRLGLFLWLVALLVALWAPPAHGQQALRFGQSGDRAEIAHHPTLAPSAITIEVWIRVHALGDTAQAGGEQTVLDKRGDTSGYNFRLAGDRFPLGAGVVAEPTLIFHPELIQAYRWHHMAMVQDADTLYFYVDGNRIDALANTYNPATESMLQLGELSGCLAGCLWLRGEIDDLRIWGRARTQAQISDSMHVHLAGDEPGLTGYWDFDDDTGTTIADGTANGNHGTLHGAAALVPSTAPVGFLPLAAPTGVRTHTNGASIAVAWTPMVGEIGDFSVYRADTLIVPVDAAHRLATVSSSESTYVDVSANPDTTYYYVVTAVDAEEHEGYASMAAPGRATPVHQDYRVGAFYYPARNPASPWPGTYVRDYLVPPQPPLLGHYDNADSAIVIRHLDWMYEYGVDFLVSSWGGEGSFADSVLQFVVLPQLSGRPTQFAVLYGAARLTDPRNVGATEEAELLADFTYLADTYFGHANMLRIDGRPVVYINRSYILGGAYEQAFSQVRSALLQLGHDVYYIGHEHSWQTLPDVAHMQFLDAVGTLSPWGWNPPDGYPLEGTSLTRVSGVMAEWHGAARSQSKPYIPGVVPGYSRRAGAPGTPIVPRRSHAGAGATSTLDESIRTFRAYVDPDLKMIMVTTWNNWSNETQVEPSIIADATSVDVSGVGDYSGGYAYTGYSTQALQVLQSLLGFDPGQVTLASPPHGAQAAPRLAVLHWVDSATDHTYHLQVASDSAFTALVVDRGRLTGTAFQTDTLAANTTHYWRVRVQSSGGSGSWPPASRFTTGSLVPVRLAYLSVEREGPGAVTVAWEVLEAANHSGFHVSRAVAGEPRVQISEHLISGRLEYEFTDTEAPAAATDYWLQEIDRSGGRHWYGPARVPAREQSPQTLRLAQNIPNPVRSGTVVPFTVPTPGHVTIDIVDVSGRVVARPFQGHCPSGSHRITWDGRDGAGRLLPNGIYFYQLRSAQGSRAMKLTVLR